MNSSATTARPDRLNLRACTASLCADRLSRHCRLSTCIHRRFCLDDRPCRGKSSSNGVADLRLAESRSAAPASTKASICIACNARPGPLLTLAKGRPLFDPLVLPAPDVQTGIYTKHSWKPLGPNGGDDLGLRRRRVTMPCRDGRINKQVYKQLQQNNTITQTQYNKHYIITQTTTTQHQQHTNTTALVNTIKRKHQLHNTIAHTHVT